MDCFLVLVLVGHTEVALITENSGQLAASPSNAFLLDVSLSPTYVFNAQGHTLYHNSNPTRKARRPSWNKVTSSGMMTKQRP